MGVLQRLGACGKAVATLPFRVVLSSKAMLVLLVVNYLIYRQGVLTEFGLSRASMRTVTAGLASLRVPALVVNLPCSASSQTKLGCCA
jgi:hypothetical protein